MQRANRTQSREFTVLFLRDTFLFHRNFQIAAIWKYSIWRRTFICAKYSCFFKAIPQFGKVRILNYLYIYPPLSIYIATSNSISIFYHSGSSSQFVFRSSLSLVEDQSEYGWFRLYALGCVWMYFSFPGRFPEFLGGGALKGETDACMLCYSS